METNPKPLLNNKIVLVVAAILLFVLAGGGAYLMLRSISPRDAGPNSSTESASKDDFRKQAEESNKAAQEALADNDMKSAAEKFSEAKELFTKAGETEKAVQAGEQQALAEQEASANTNSEETIPRQTVR